MNDWGIMNYIEESDCSQASFAFLFHSTCKKAAILGGTGLYVFMAERQVEPTATWNLGTVAKYRLMGRKEVATAWADGCVDSTRRQQEPHVVRAGIARTDVNSLWAMHEKGGDG